MPIRLQSQADFEVVRTAWQTGFMLQADAWRFGDPFQCTGPTLGPPDGVCSCPKASLDLHQVPAPVGGSQVQESLKLLREEAQRAVFWTEPEGTFRSMYVSAENRLKNNLF